MAQHDYVINNDTAPNVRSDINLALAAIASNNSGATEPATTYANMFWYDTDTDVMKQRNENNSAWVTLELTPTTLVSLTQAQAEDDASTVFGTVSGQRLGQAISAAVQYMMVRDEKTNATAAQSLTANTWTKRDLNTVVDNSISGASLSSSVITLPAGTYRISASVPGYKANAFKARLRHNTSAITYGVSTSENSHSSFDTSAQVLIKNQFTLGSTTDVKIEMIVQTTSNGGAPAGAITNNAEIEIYTIVEFWKIA